MNSIRYINLGILAHVDAGKTTVTEALLHVSGAVRRFGRVDHGDTVADFLDVERERGITVRAATVSFRYKDTKVNILDTPGHMDFIAEVERSLSVLDAAVLVVSAREGVQSQTRAIWSALQKQHIPTLVFINKLDRLGADYEGAVGQLEALMGPVLPRQRVIDARPETLPLTECEGLLERLFDVDDEIADRYAAGEEITDEQLSAAYLRAVARGRLFPVYAGVALSELGIDKLMDAIVRELPCAPRGSDALSALVYKLEFHPRLGEICYARMYGGALEGRMDVAMPDGRGFKVRMLFSPDEGALRGAGRVSCGDIAVLPSYGILRVGSVIGEAPPVQNAHIAEPLLLTHASAQDVPRDKLLDALSKLALEDPLLDLRANAQTGDLELRVFGQVQMEILTELALDRFGIRLHLDEARTIFRERPMRRGVGDVKWGETKFAAAIGISIEPLPLGSGLKYATRVDYGYLTASYQNAVRDGLLGAMRNGLYGWELTDARVTLEWAEYESSASTPGDYRDIAVVAVIRALNDSDTELLEPVLDYELTVPVDDAGRASWDLGEMRATIETADGTGDEITYAGRVALDTSKNYARQVAAYTAGVGVFSVRNAGYALYEGDKRAVMNEGACLPTEEWFLLKKSGRA